MRNHLSDSQMVRLLHCWILWAVYGTALLSVGLRTVASPFAPWAERAMVALVLSVFVLRPVLLAIGARRRGELKSTLIATIIALGAGYTLARTIPFLKTI